LPVEYDISLASIGVRDKNNAKRVTVHSTLVVASKVRTREDAAQRYVALRIASRRSPLFSTKTQKGCLFF